VAERPDESSVCERCGQISAICHRQLDEAARIMAEKNPTFDPDIVNAQWKASIAAMQTDYVRSTATGSRPFDRLQRHHHARSHGIEDLNRVDPRQLFAQGSSHLR